MNVEQICSRWGIVEPKVVNDTLFYYEWCYEDCRCKKRLYFKQAIDIKTGEFTTRTKLKRKPNWYAQHI